MAKIKVSADTVLAILKGIMEDSEINYIIEDVSAADWRGKKVQEALNVEYYTFRHRPVDSEMVIEELMKQGMPSNELHSLTRSFCILSLTSTDRVFSKNNDIVTVSANLEYWIQSEKVKLLEDMFEDIAVETTGVRIPVQIGKEERQAVGALGSLNITDMQETSEYGEMSVCEIDIDIIFHPNVVTMSDYKVEFAVDGEWVHVPISGLSLANTMTQKAVPKANNVREVGSINLSRVKSFVFTFDGYKNSFIDSLIDDSFTGDLPPYKNIDNNLPLSLRLTRKNKEYIYDCVIKDHSVTVQEDTGNETHSLTLTKRGVKNGSSQS